MEDRTGAIGTGLLRTSFYLLLALAVAACADDSPLGPVDAELAEARSGQVVEEEQDVSSYQARRLIGEAHTLLARARSLAAPNPDRDVLALILRASNAHSQAITAFREGDFKGAAALAKDSSAASRQAIRILTGGMERR